MPRGDHALFSVADKNPFILAVGRLWDEAKNIAMSIRSPPPLMANLCRRRRTPSVRGQVHIVGQAARTPQPSNFASWLSQAAIYALPARYEPFGLSVLEGGAPLADARSSSAIFRAYADLGRRSAIHSTGRRRRAPQNAPDREPGFAHSWHGSPLERGPAPCNIPPSAC